MAPKEQKWKLLGLLKPRPGIGTVSCPLRSVSQNVTRVAWIQEEEK